VAVELKCATTRWLGLSRVLQREAVRLLRMLRLETCELSLVLAGDRTVRRLNRDFRGLDEATDVLSFPQMEYRDAYRRGREPGASAPRHSRAAGPSPARAADAERPPLALGDVVISVDTARRQAHALGVDQASRLRALLIHGTLHLLGYDHERSAAEARRMFARERELARHLAGESAKLDPEWPPAAMPTAGTRGSGPRRSRRRKPRSPGAIHRR